MASIQIYPMLAATIPSTLDATTTLNQFKDAAKTWRDANCNTVGFNFLTQVTSSSLSIQFMSVDSYFHDPANDGGVTHLQVDPDYRQIVYSTENSLWDATTDIMFNSSDSFNFYWSNSLNSGNYGNLDICFEAVALHEIGHLIGFDHCTVNTAIMYNQILSGPTSIRTSLNSNDITEIHIMADCEPPGIPSPNILQVESKIDFINPNDKK
ncbi:MAG: matrixin family metalloprotease [Ignavibacteriaceae bacterium]|nr:matrixin family metalloprotease [Ignavibacteriaceae bacterium]